MTRSPRSGFARWRVPLGFVVALTVLWFVAPTPRSLAVGIPIALAGQLLRLWAAGHLEKSREVTRSGPYRWTRHPLYAGSALMGVGFAVASGSLVVTGLLAAYLIVTIAVAVRTEEAYLRAAFGDAYDRYAAGTAPEVSRRFSATRVVRNKEYRSALGFVVVCAALVIYAWVRSG